MELNRAFWWILKYLWRLTFTSFAVIVAGALRTFGRCCNLEFKVMIYYHGGGSSLISLLRNRDMLKLTLYLLKYIYKLPIEETDYLEVMCSKITDLDIPACPITIYVSSNSSSHHKRSNPFYRT